MRSAAALLAFAILLSNPSCRKPPPAPKLDFTVYGGCRHIESIHTSICEAMVRSRPAFVVVTGDVVDEPELLSDWISFRRSTKELRAGAAYYPVRGDHDTEPTRTFEREFGLDKLYYDRLIGDIHFFFLDFWGFDDAEQMKWFEERAVASKALHKIAVFHRPPFSIDPNRGQAEAAPIHRQIHGRLVKLKFCAAFTGHNHCFYTTVRDGVRYLTTAGGGAPLWKIDGKLAQPGDLWRKFYHYVGCRVLDRKITAQVFEIDGVEVPELAFTVCEHPR